MLDELFSESRTFRTLHQISLDLAKTNSLDDLYRGIVDRGLRDMGFDRIGLLLFDKKTSMISGTWGTDQQGNLCNEAYVNRPLTPESTFIWEALNRKLYVSVEEGKSLWHYDKKVGFGWNAMVAIWEDDDPIGWIAVDNLIHGRPCTPATRNAIAFYGNTVSHLIIRKRFELDLQNRVEQQTKELADKVSLLEKTMDHLVETEKLASLGRLVAGVAHEINTPLGNAILGISYSGDLAANLREVLETKEVGKSWVLGRLTEMTVALTTSSANLSRAAGLVHRFKQLARDQHQEFLDPDMDVLGTLENILAGFIHLLKVHRVEVKTTVETGLRVPSYPGLLTQILGNFLSNTIAHGCQSSGEGGNFVEIAVYRPVPATWILEYQDHGPGVSPEVSTRIFEPFFTTTRATGGSGLGLSIVHTLVCEKMGGTIAVYKPVGGGLGFRLTLPAV